MKFYHYLFFLVAAAISHAATPPDVRGASVMVIDANNGNVLFSRNANEQRPVGSTQKLLTALLVVEHGDLGHRVTIEPIDEATEPTMMGLRPGESYSRQELLTALLVHSANDAARTLARDQAGSLENFAVLMNEKAAQLGMTSSHFVNPNGLPAANQYSTAADMATLAFAAYHNPTIRAIVSTKNYSFHQANGRVQFLKNTNHTLLDNFFCNGMKTGYTDKSKHCLVTSGSYQGHEAITVILGSANRSQLFRDSAALLAWALGLRTLPVAALARTSSAIESSPHRKIHHGKRHRKKSS